MAPILTLALLLQAGWQTVAPKGEAFAVKMPAPPQFQTMSNSQAGYTVQTRIYRTASPNGVFQIVVMHPVGKVDETFRKALVTGFKGGLLRSSGAKELSQSKGKLGSYPGILVVFSAGVNRGEYWAIESKGDVFVAIAVAPAPKLGAAKAAFFGSFRLK